jgi:plastocyanin
MRCEQGHMRLWLLLSGVLASVANGSPGSAVVDLHGTARSGDRPEPRAIVWLDATDTAAPVAPAKPRLDQRNLDFSPRILAVRVGTVVDFPNNDRVFHNVFSFHDGKRFDLGLYPVGTVKHVKFDHPGLSRIFCNIHPNMAAYVMVVDTPHYSVSDTDGRFTIEGVGRGSYTYHAWRPGGPELTGSAVVEAGRSLDLRWP